MAKGKIQEPPAELFSYGWRDKKEQRVYHFTGLDGKPKEEYLGQADTLMKARCPLDNAYLIAYSGDPHKVIECPCCHQSFSDLYTPEKYAEQQRRRLRDLEEELAKAKQVIAIQADKNHPVRAANARNLHSVNELSDTTSS